MAQVLPIMRTVSLHNITYNIPNVVEQWRMHIPSQFDPNCIQNNTGAAVAYMARQALRIIIKSGFWPYTTAEIQEWLNINNYFTLGLEQDFNPVMVFCQIRLWVTLLNDLIIIGEMFPSEVFVEII